MRYLPGPVDPQQTSQKTSINSEMEQKMGPPPVYLSGESRGRSPPGRKGGMSLKLRIDHSQGEKGERRGERGGERGREEDFPNIFP